LDTSTIILIATILGLLPISEIRGSAIYVFAASSNPLTLILGLLAGLAANLTIPFIAFKILDLLDALFKSKYTPRIIKKTYLLILKYGRRKASSIKGKGYAGLAIFVGMPLPFTGAWTGTLVAYILGLNRKKSTIAIEAGVLLATLIVSLTISLSIEVLRKLFLL
jgi:uncharacterized membrane protein